MAVSHIHVCITRKGLRPLPRERELAFTDHGHPHPLPHRTSEELFNELKKWFFFPCATIHFRIQIRSADSHHHAECQAENN